MPEPFRIAVAEDVLADLRDRLVRTRWAPVLAAPRWSLGADPETLQRLVAYWVDGFDWRAQEQWMNAIPQFRADVDGQQLHYLRLGATGTGTSRPLVLLHGWPGSFLEMTRLLPLLAAGDNAYDVIVPSLPGFGFSTRPAASGYGYRAIATTLHRLLTDTLGLDRFGLHGTDVGSTVAGWLAIDHPESVIGVHTMEPYTPRPSFVAPAAPATDAEQAFFADFDRWAQAEGAYFRLQNTKPATLAASLEDSPVGALAWLVEKYHSWSDCDGDLRRRYTDDDLLTIVTLYWVTRTLSTSVHAYYESRFDGVVGPQDRSGVPGGVALSRAIPTAPPRHVPRELVERLYDVRHWVQLERGGHFASWEEPELVAGSLRAFFDPLFAGSARS